MNRKRITMLELENKQNKMGELVLIPKPSVLEGVTKPRIQHKTRDFPSRGQEMIDFCAEIGYPLLKWQKYLAIEAHKYKPDNRWLYPEIVAIMSRQNGKSTFMALRILTGMFVWGEKLQLGTAHKLTTSSEIFYKILEIIETNPKLAGYFEKKFESKGLQEIRLHNGARYIIRANNNASRGISAPSTIHLDEVREYHDEDVWASMRYTQMASPNPQIWIYSSAGDQHSIVLNKLRERGLAAAAGADDPIGYFEWSAEVGVKIDPDDPEFWEGIAQANPSLGFTIHPDNIRAILNDPEDIIRTEVLSQWVDTINPVIVPSQWHACEVGGIRLSPDADTWLAVDLSPDRKHAALVASQRMGDQFILILLQTWFNPSTLDDRQMANDIADWVRKFPTQLVAYSKRTAGAVASRLKPAGIQIADIDGLDYAQSCDEFLSAVASGRVIHAGNEELTKQVLSAVKLPFGDGGWIMGRKISNAIICGAVACSMAGHFATRPETEIDIVVA